MAFFSARLAILCVLLVAVITHAHESTEVRKFPRFRTHQRHPLNPLLLLNQVLESIDAIHGVSQHINSQETWFSPKATEESPTATTDRIADLGEEVTASTSVDQGLPGGLKAGTVVSIKVGTKYCRQGEKLTAAYNAAYRWICDSAIAEPYHIMDAGGGYIVLVAGSQAATGVSLDSAKLMIVDVGSGKVALKSKGTGKYCTGHLSSPFDCVASSKGSSFIIKPMTAQMIADARKTVKCDTMKKQCGLISPEFTGVCASTKAAIFANARKTKGACNPAVCWEPHPLAKDAAACQKSDECKQSEACKQMDCKILDGSKKPPPRKDGILISKHGQKMPAAKKRFALTFNLKLQPSKTKVYAGCAILPDFEDTCSKCTSESWWKTWSDPKFKQCEFDNLIRGDWQHIRKRAKMGCVTFYTRMSRETQACNAHCNRGPWLDKWPKTPCVGTSKEPPGYLPPVRKNPTDVNSELSRMPCVCGGSNDLRWTNVCPTDRLKQFKTPLLGLRDNRLRLLWTGQDATGKDIEYEFLGDPAGPFAAGRWYSVTVVVDMQPPAGQDVITAFIDGEKASSDPMSEFSRQPASGRMKMPKTHAVTNPYMSENWVANTMRWFEDPNINRLQFVPDLNMQQYTFGRFENNEHRCVNDLGETLQTVSDFRYHPDFKTLSTVIKPTLPNDVSHTSCGNEARFVMTNPCARTGTCLGSLVSVPTTPCTTKDGVTVCTKGDSIRGSPHKIMAAMFDHEYHDVGATPPSNPDGYSPVKFSRSGRGWGCFNRKGCISLVPYRPIMMLEKRIACRSWLVKGGNGKEVKQNECSASKKLQCYVYIGKSDYDYSGVVFPENWDPNTGNPGHGGDMMHNPRGNVLRSGGEGKLRPTFFKYLAGGEHEVDIYRATKALQNLILPGLKDGRTLTCKDFGTKFNKDKKRQVDPKAMTSPKEASRIWQAELETWASLA